MSNVSEQFASAELASFAANLNASMIPDEVFRKAEDLLVDWFGSALAGKGCLLYTSPSPRD